MPTNEQVLIASILDKDLAEVPESILPMTSKLQLAMQKAFLENLQGPNVDALRRCINALKNGSPYRGTVAYEALAIFQTPNPNPQPLNPPPQVLLRIFTKPNELEDLCGVSEWIPRMTYIGQPFEDSGYRGHSVRVQAIEEPSVFVDVELSRIGEPPLWTCRFKGNKSPWRCGYTKRVDAVENAIKVVRAEVLALKELRGQGKIK